MEQVEQNEVMQLRKDVNNLKEVVEKIAFLLNKRLMKELYEEVKNIEDGEYLNEEDFSRKHRIKIH